MATSDEIDPKLDKLVAGLDKVTSGLDDIGARLQGAMRESAELDARDARLQQARATAVDPSRQIAAAGRIEESSRRAISRADRVASEFQRLLPRSQAGVSGGAADLTRMTNSITRAVNDSAKRIAALPPVEGATPLQNVQRASLLGRQADLQQLRQSIEDLAGETARRQVTAQQARLSAVSQQMAQRDAVTEARRQWSQIPQLTSGRQQFDPSRGSDQFSEREPLWSQRRALEQRQAIDRIPSLVTRQASQSGVVLPGARPGRPQDIVIPGSRPSTGPLVTSNQGVYNQRSRPFDVSDPTILRKTWSDATRQGISDALRNQATGGFLAGGGAGGRPPIIRPTAAGGASSGDNSNRAVDELAASQERLSAARSRAAAADATWRSGVQSSTLAVNESTTAMRANGVLSQQFINAAVRGEASWREWGYQVSNVTTKFGAWAVAGSGVYAVFDGIRRIGTGALVSGDVGGGLSRTINNLNVDKAKESVRELSREFNVSTADAEQAIEIQSRRFGDLSASVEAAKTALYGVKVGDLGVEDASNYTMAIANGLGIGIHNAKELQLIFDQINQAQNNFGVAIKETMQGIGTAAGTFTNAGGDRTQLIALISAIEKTTGRSGREAGTAVQRMASFINRPGNQERLQAFGVDTAGTITDTINSAFDVASKLIKQGRPQDINKLAEALADPQIGSRIAPALANPDLFRQLERGLTPEASAGSSRKELDNQLSRFSEQLQKVLNNLERLGSNLEQGGLLNGIGALVLGVNELLGVVNGLLGAFNTIPGPIRTIVSSLVALELGLAATRKLNTGGVGAGGPLGGIISNSKFSLEQGRAEQTLRLTRDRIQQEIAATAKREASADLSRGIAGRTATSIDTQMRGLPPGTDPAVLNQLALQKKQQLDIETSETQKLTNASLQRGQLQRELTHYDDQLVQVSKARNMKELQRAAGNTPIQTDTRRTTTNPQTTVGGGTFSRTGAEAAASEQVVAAKTKEAAAGNAAAVADERRAAAANAATAADARQAAASRSGLIGRANAGIINAGQVPIRDRVSAASAAVQRQAGALTIPYAAARDQGAGRLAASAIQAQATASAAAGKAAITATSAVSRLGAGVSSFGRGVYGLIGPLGLAAIAAVGFQFAIDKILKKQKDAVDFADKLASQVGGGAASNQANIQSAQGVLGKTLSDLASSGQRSPEIDKALEMMGVKAKASYDYLWREFMRQEALTLNKSRVENLDPKKLGSIHQLRIEDIIGDTGWITDTMNQFRAGLIDPKTMRKLLDAGDQQSSSSNISKDEQIRIKGTLSRLRAELITEVDGLASLREGGIGNANPADLKAAADRGAAAAAIGKNPLQNIELALSANRALAAQALTPDKGSPDYDAVLKFRDDNRKLIQSSISNGVEDDMALANSEQEKRAVFNNQLDRITALQKKTKLGSRDVSALDRKIKSDKDQEKDLEGLAKNGISGNLTTTGPDSPFGSGFQGLDNDEIKKDATKRLTDIRKRIARNQKQRKAINDGLTDEERYLEILRRELTMQEFDREQTVNDSVNQLQLARTNAGMPKLELTLQQAKQKLAAAIKAGLPIERINQYKTEIENALSSVVDERMNLLQSEAALSQAKLSGNQGAQQQDNITQIQRQLGFMQQNRQRYSQSDINNKLAELETAKNAVTQAAVEDAKAYTQAVGNLAKSRTEDPIQQATIDLKTATQVFNQGGFKTKADRLNAMADVNTAKTQLRNQKVDSQLGDIDFLAQMEKITVDQQIARLQKLLKVAGLSKDRMRQIRLKIKQLQDEQNGNDGELDLNVGDIKIPTLTDIRRAVVGRQSGVSIDNRNTVNVNVNNAADVNRVYQALDDHVSGFGRAQRRAAGRR